MRHALSFSLLCSLVGCLPNLGALGEGEGEGESTGVGIQWSVDGAAREGVQPTADFTFDAQNDVSGIGVSDAATVDAGVETFLAQILYVSGETIAAGSYACGGSVVAPPVVNIQIGQGSVAYNATGATDCSITLDAEVAEGNGAHGSFSGTLVQIGGSATIDVEGTFNFDSSI